jgi:hypothetical protein
MKPTTKKSKQNGELVVAKHQRVGRPRQYDRDVVMAEFNQRTADGESMREICADAHMPSTTAICEWLQEHTGYAERHARAMEFRGQRFAEQIISVCRETMQGKHDVHAARLYVDSLKWTASRLSPKVYGDRVEQHLTGDVTATLVPILKRD